MKKYFSLVIATAVFAGFYSCRPEASIKKLQPNLPIETYDYLSGMQNVESFNIPYDNRPNNDVITLGRVLFYDSRLSFSNTIACASCHKQEYAFADNVPLSLGFEGKTTIRNTPAIINAAGKMEFFWDGRETSLESQTLMPVKNHIEMGMENMNVLAQKLNRVDYYPDLFKKAFHTPEITPEKISKALAQFVRAIVSFRSKMDLSTYTTTEQQGKILFNNKYRCATCHEGNNIGGPFFNFNSYNNTRAANIGLDINCADKGIGALTGNPNDDGTFIIPSLRNVALTAPYMHDGRYKTLDEVIDHYSTQIEPSPNLDVILLQMNWPTSGTQQNIDSHQPVKMNISAAEKQQLIAFLKTLTDSYITTDTKFSNPFK